MLGKRRREAWHEESFIHRFHRLQRLKYDRCCWISWMGTTKLPLAALCAAATSVAATCGRRRRFPHTSLEQARQRLPVETERSSALNPPCARQGRAPTAATDEHARNSSHTKPLPLFVGGVFQPREPHRQHHPRKLNRAHPRRRDAACTGTRDACHHDGGAQTGSALARYAIGEKRRHVSFEEQFLCVGSPAMLPSSRHSSAVARPLNSTHIKPPPLFVGGASSPANPNR